MRRLGAPMALVLGVGLGLGVGGCLYGSCPETPAPGLASLTRVAATGPSFDEDPIDGELRLDVDMVEATVTVSYESDGHEVVRVYAITSTMEGSYY